MLVRFYSDESYFKSFLETQREATIGKVDAVLTNQPEFYELESDSKQQKVVKDQLGRRISHSKRRNFSYLSRACEVLFIRPFDPVLHENYRGNLFVNYPLVYFLSKNQGNYNFGCRVKIANAYEAGPDTRVRIPYTKDLFNFFKLGFDLDTSDWQVMCFSSPERQVFSIPLNASVCNLNENLSVAFGGKKGNFLNEVILIEKNLEQRRIRLIKIQPEDDLIPSMEGSGICGYNGKVYIHGGFNEHKVFAEVYELVIKKEAEEYSVEVVPIIASGIPQLYNHYLVACRGKLYAFLGRTKGSSHNKHCFEMDLESLIWKKIPLSEKQVLTLNCEKQKFSEPVVKGPLIIMCFNNNKKDQEQPAWLLLFNTETKKISSVRYEFECIKSIHDAPGNYLLVLGEALDFVYLSFGTFYQCQLPGGSKENIYSLLEKAFSIPQLGDILVKCLDGEFYVNSLFLSVRMRDSEKLVKKISNRVLNLSNYKKEIAQVALKFLYCDSVDLSILNEEVNSSLKTLINFSSKFGIPFLENYCKLKLRNLNPKVSKINLYSDYMALHRQTYEEIPSLRKQESLEQNFEGILSDFQVTVQDQTFSCHKALLVLRSNYFRSFFSFNPKLTETFINEVTPAAMKNVLKYIYYDETSVPRQEMTEVLFACRFLEVHGLFIELQREMCIKMSPGNLPVFLEQALELNASNLIVYCVNFIRKNWKHIPKTQEYSWIKEENPFVFEYINNEIEQSRQTQPLPTELIEVGQVEEAEKEEIIVRALEENPLPSLNQMVPNGFDYLEPSESSLETFSAQIQNLEKNFGRVLNQAEEAKEAIQHSFRNKFKSLEED